MFVTHKEFKNRKYFVLFLYNVEMERTRYIEWFLTSMIFQFGSFAYNIDREVCLETPFVFAMVQDACRFSLTKARNVFESEMSNCPRRCNIKMNNLKSGEWHQLTTIYINLDRSDQYWTTISTSCRYANREDISIDIICKREDLCTKDMDCEDQTKTCLLAGLIGVCVCKPGYLGFGNECYKGNLRLNEKCKRNEQCSVAFGSVCLDGTCVCRPGYSPFNETECFLSDISENLCTSTKLCTDVSKTCMLTGQIGECVCNPGYIGFGNTCLQGNLKLNETCQRNEQCSNVSGSLCQNETCTCTQGYVQLNDSECVFSSSDGSLQARFQDPKENSIAGLTAGAVFGGLILGVVLTVITVTIYHHIRRRETKERKYPKIALYNNTSEEAEIDAPQSNSRTNERKIVNVSPFAHSVDLPTKRNVQEGGKRTMMNDVVNNDVYNHLHEKEASPDVDDTYDHAHGNLDNLMEESDYSNLNSERRNKNHDISVSETNDYDFQEPAGEYMYYSNEK
ncbi:uncharacterized protein LOC134260412 isoform X2 [Saccostrea cucullata]|uniref:uncharacterized protein LOC134260412 isoform X2 n=1 Tax=Saccostrea cuccullata TaxID=36930 RepID=UPI002ED43A17